MNKSLGLNKAPREFEIDKVHQPINSESYTSLELPAHLYVEALRAGKMHTDHWAYLIVHATMVLQLAATKSPESIMVSIAEKAIDILNRGFMTFVKDGQYILHEEDMEMLAYCMTSMGDYYRGFTKRQVFAAKAEGARKLIPVMQRLGAVWEG